MWARRLVGEALTQAQRVGTERAAFASLFAGNASGEPGAAVDLAGVAAMFQRLTTAHTNRMSAVGLNN